MDGDEAVLLLHRLVLEGDVAEAPLGRVFLQDAEHLDGVEGREGGHDLLALEVEGDEERLVPALAVVGEPVVGVADGDAPLLVEVEAAGEGDPLHVLVDDAAGSGEWEVVLLQDDADVGDLAGVVEVQDIDSLVGHCILYGFYYMH